MDTNATFPTSFGTSAAPSTTTILPSVAVPASATTPPVPVLLAYAKPSPDISRIEVFSGQNFKHWQERIYSTLDMYGVAWFLSTENTLPNFEAWTHTNKVCRHTILMSTVPTRKQRLYGTQCLENTLLRMWVSKTT